MSLYWEIKLGDYDFESGSDGHFPDITRLLLKEDLIKNNSTDFIYSILREEFIRRLELVGYNEINIQDSIKEYKTNILNKKDYIRFRTDDFRIKFPDNDFWNQVKRINYEYLTEALFDNYSNKNNSKVSKNIVTLFQNNGFDHVIDPYFDPLILYYIFSKNILTDNDKILIDLSEMSHSELWSNYIFEDNHFDETISQFDTNALVLNQQYSGEETINTEFKSVNGNVLSSIKGNLKKYGIGFLNSDGGEIIWGIEDKGQITGFDVDGSIRDQIRKNIYAIIGSIYPPVALNKVNITFINLITNGVILENRCCLKVFIEKGNQNEMYFSEGGRTWIKLEGILKELKGYELFKYIIENY